MKRRDFIGVGGGVVAGAAVGAVGSRLGSGLATDGQLVAMASSRGLSGDEARGALQTAVPPGKYDPYYMFASGGHLGQVQVIGVPSMRLLKVIPVVTRDAYSGYGFGADLGDGVIHAGSDPAKSEPLGWGAVARSAYHPARPQPLAGVGNVLVVVLFAIVAAVWLTLAAQVWRVRRVCRGGGGPPKAATAG